MNSYTRRDFLVSAGAAGLTLSAGMLNCGNPGSTAKPNVLCLMADQHRFDFMGCSSGSRIHTPNLDSIAAGGVRFTSGYSSTPTCTPARSALLTGMSPWNHGMLGYGRVVPKYEVELPQAMRDAGYYTFGIGKMHWFPQKSLHGFHKTLVDESGRVESPGFISDYRKWFKQQVPDLDPDATGIGWNDYRAKTYVLPEELHPTYWTGKTAVEFINNYSSGQPFFLKVSFARPHSPYDPPQRFMDLHDLSDMPGPAAGTWAEKYREYEKPLKPTLWHGDLGVQQVKISRKAYAGSVSFIDEQIGGIILALKRKNLYKNTLIVFIADHGDMLGDHFMWRKSYAYEASAHIPYLLKWPESIKAKISAGSTLANPVELRDILPTFLDCAGAPVPDCVDGLSLLSLVRGKQNYWRENLDLEHSRCYSPENHWNALTDGSFKYLFHAHDGSEQLFDLKNDPGELHDLSADTGYGKILSEWRDKMTEYLSIRGEEFVQGGKLVSPRKNILYSPNYPKKQS